MFMKVCIQVTRPAVFDLAFSVVATVMQVGGIAVERHVCDRALLANAERISG